jgi:aromatic-L-amino-acid decarboxylase
MRLYGQDGLRAHIRKGVALAKKFEAMVLADERFEIVVPVQMGLVCFRLNGPNSINERLNKSLYTEGQVYLCPSTLGDTYFMRMAIGSVLAEETDIQFAWEAICKQATDLLKAQSK